MGMMRSWRYRLYPSKVHQQQLNNHFYECKNLRNFLLENIKKHYEETGEFPTRKQLYLLTKQTNIFSQLAQNVADRLYKSIRGMLAKKKLGKKVGFPRFKSIDRIKSFTYPQFGFRLNNQNLYLSGIGEINLKMHREMQGNIKTLTIKKTPSGKYFAIFTTEIETTEPKKNKGAKVGIDLGIENLGYLSDGTIIENPRHLKKAEEKLKKTQKKLSNKKKGSKNRRKARLKVAITYEKLVNKRSDFLHKTSRKLAENYSIIAMENLNVSGLSRKGFLAKHVLDCSQSCSSQRTWCAGNSGSLPWAEFANMLRYKAEEAGSEVVLVNPAYTSQKCSSCGLIQKKKLAERWYKCSCGASMHRDHNAAVNILRRAKCLDLTQSVKQRNILIRGTLGHRETNACGDDYISSLNETRSPVL
ncbi:transposase [Candidatus Micrarchaeota archaeon]|nr:transposase [Candidatus Micrarchaeota archaeon]MBU1166368.1 transposase [Candidatus Micrarchaeota archaeon]MBU1886892.1 transposase [Candidatus Micrarchaeota archaeon]